MSGVALDWLYHHNYLVDREQFVRLGADSSDTVTLPSGLPHDSVLGPLLFIMYPVDLIDVILSNHLLPHLYADDTQLYGSSRPGDVSTLAARVAGCVKVVAEWMRSNRLQLACNSTRIRRKFFAVASTRRQYQLPSEPLS